MYFGKLVDGFLQMAPNSIVVGDYRIVNPSANQYREAGFLPVVFTESPAVEDGYYLESSWVQEESQIKRIWTKKTAEPAPQVDTGMESTIVDAYNAGVNDA